MEVQNLSKTTRRAEFLRKMDEIIPWGKIVELVQPYYYNKKLGRKLIPLETMLRMYFLQIWFSLSDPAVEDAIYDSLAFKEFMKISFGNFKVPDETTLCNFRHLLEENKIGEKINELVKNMLENSGLIMHGETVVDATIITASKSTRNENHERDPEMKSTKKGGNYYFGGKIHIGVDDGTGYVHSFEVTAANEHDVTVAHKLVREDDEYCKGDSGYIGVEKREEILADEHLAQVEFRTVRHPSSKKAKSECQKYWNKKVESYHQCRYRFHEKT